MHEKRGNKNFSLLCKFTIGYNVHNVEQQNFILRGQWGGDHFLYRKAALLEARFPIPNILDKAMTFTGYRCFRCF